MQLQPAPSTNGGPTRRMQTKRRSISSLSPPLHRGPVTQPLVIPPSPASEQGDSARLPLGMHSSGWFHPRNRLGTSLRGATLMHHDLGSSLSGSLQTNMDIESMSEFSLPTAGNVHGGFSAFGSAGLPSIGTSRSSKNMSMGMGLGSGKADSPTAASAGELGDLTAKQ